jgi:hypothetical protein
MGPLVATEVAVVLIVVYELCSHSRSTFSWTDMTEMSRDALTDPSSIHRTLQEQHGYNYKLIVDSGSKVIFEWVYIWIRISKQRANISF